MVHRSSTPPSHERRRPRIAAMERGPGPAQYCLPGTCGSVRHDPSRKQSPAFSFGARTKQFSSLNTSSSSPGPVHFVSPSVTRTGASGTPAFSVYSRPQSRNLERSPGPAAYNVSKTPQAQESRPLSCSFGIKMEPLQSRSKMPAPNAYSLPSLMGPSVIGKKSSPAYTLPGRANRGGFDEDLKKTPPPGTYLVVKPQVYSRGSPTYSILGRNYLPGDKTMKPGPGAYSPEKVVVDRKQIPPSYSFGTKHSEYLAPVLDTVI